MKRDARPKGEAGKLRRTKNLTPESRTKSIDVPASGAVPSPSKRRHERPVVSPRATGGAPAVFEHRVAAVFLAELLAGGSSSYFDCDRIIGVGLQQSVHGAVADDIVIEYELAGAREFFDLDVKSGLSLVPSDDDFHDVIDACLHRLDHIFDRPGIYGFATRFSNQTAAMEALRDVIARAVNEARPLEFEAALLAAGSANREMRDVYKHLKATIISVEPDATAERVHEFLFRFKALSIGVDGPMTIDEKRAIFRIKETFKKSEDEARAIFEALVRIAGDIGNTAGFVTRDRLLELLRRRSVRLHNVIDSAATSASVSYSSTSVALQRVTTGSLPESLIAIGSLAQEALIGEVADVRRALREGRFDAAGAGIESLRAADRWILLKDEERAVVVTLQARLALVEGNTDLANSLLLEAEAIRSDAPAVVRLRLSLKSATDGPDAALSEMPEAKSLEFEQLRAALLLETGESAKALAVLEPLKRDGETYRLLALAYLLSAQIGEALDAVTAGLSSDPHYLGLRIVQAIVEFNAALVYGVALPIVNTPPPIPQSFVGADQDAIEHLATATALFDNLRREPHDSAYTPMLDAFWVASLLLQRNVASAQAAVKQILAERPTSYGVIAWAIARGLEFDVEAVTTALQRQVDTEPDVQSVQFLAILYAKQSRPRAAIDLLLHLRSVFADARQMSLFYALLFNAYLDAGDEVDAVSVLQQTQSPLHNDLETALLEARAERTGDWEDVIRNLTIGCESDPSAQNLLRLSIALGNARRYADLAMLSDSLLELRSFEANVMALQALFNVGQFQKFINAAESVGIEKLPLRAKIATAQAYERLGRFGDAASLLGEITSISDDYDALLMLARMQVKLGDAAGLRVATTRLLSHPDAQADALMLLADIAAVTHRDVAIKLWRKAAPTVSDDAVSLALPLGYRLGLDADPLMQVLTARMAAGVPGVQRYDVEQVRELFAVRAENVQRLFSQYTDGRISVHMLADHGGLSIPLMYAQALDENTQAVQRPTLLLAHGGRIGTNVELPERPTLNVDITALLLWSFLGVLESVTSHYSVAIPAETYDILSHMAETLGSHQPSVDARRKVIRRLIDANLIIATSEDEFDAAPADQVFSLNDDASENLTRYTELLDLIKRRAQIAPKIYLRPGVIEILDREALIGLTERAKVLITVEEDRRLRLEATSRERRDEVRGWLEELMGNLQAGFGTTYSVLPSLIDDSQVLNKPYDATASLMGLISQRFQHDDVLVIDDRFASGFLRAGDGAKIVTSFDIFRDMLRRGWVTSDSYYGLRDRLRSANALFSIIEPNEIINALLESPVGDSGELVETPALRNIRRYVARVLQMRSSMQTPGSSSSPDFAFGEVSAVLEVSRAIASAFVHLWRKDAASELRTARARYVLDYLYFDDQPNLHAAGVVQPARSKAEISALALATLLFRILEDWPGVEMTGEYVQFVCEELIQPRVLTDYTIVAPLSQFIRDFIVALTGTAKNDQENRIRIAAISHILRYLPQSVLKELAQHPVLQSMFGIAASRNIAAGNLQFRAEDLWHAAYAYLSTQEKQSVTELRRGRRFTVHVDGTMIALEDGEGNKEVISEPVIALFGADSAEREQFILANRSWFDMPRATLSDLIGKLRDASDWLQTMYLIADARNRNVVAYYHNLAAQSTDDGTPDSLPPDPLCILEHIRIRPQKPVLEQLPTAATELLSEKVDIASVIWRLAALPVSLPAAVVESFAALSPEIQLEVVGRLGPSTRVPTVMYNVCNLIASAGTYPERNEHVRSMSKAMLDQLADRSWVAGFLAIVRWSEFLLSGKIREDTDDPAALIAWYHGARVFEILANAGFSPHDIASYYENRNRQVRLIEVPSRRNRCFDPYVDALHFTVMGIIHGLEKAGSIVDDEVLSGLKQSLLPAGIARPGVDAPSEGPPEAYLCCDYIGKMRELFGRDVARAYSPAQRMKDVSSIVTMLERDPKNGTAWAVLLKSPQPLPKRLAKRLRSIILEVPLAEAFDDVQSINQFRPMAKNRSLLSDKAVQQSLLDKSQKGIERINQAPPLSLTTELEQAAAELLNDIAVSIAAAEEGLLERDARYAEILFQFSSRWPKLLRIAEPYLMSLVRHLPSERGAALAPLVVAVRSI